MKKQFTIKLLSAIFVTVFIFSGYFFFCERATVIALSDTTPPAVQSIGVNKARVRAGETITVTVAATDDLSGIKLAQVIYSSPSGQVTKGESLKFGSDGKLRANLTIGKHDESGLWQVRFIRLEDHAGNVVFVHNSKLSTHAPVQDFSAGRFTVQDTESDTTPPAVQSIGVNKARVRAGETITVTVAATDDLSGIKSAQVHYSSPSGQVTKGESLKFGSDGKLRANLTIGKHDESGLWQVRFIRLEDHAGNVVFVHNSKLSTHAPVRDFSAGGFTVVHVTSETTFPTEGETIPEVTVPNQTRESTIKEQITTPPTKVTTTAKATEVTVPTQPWENTIKEQTTTPSTKATTTVKATEMTVPTQTLESAIKEQITTSSTKVTMTAKATTEHSAGISAKPSVKITRVVTGNARKSPAPPTDELPKTGEQAPVFPQVFGIVLLSLALVIVLRKK